jgi:hypothetical protein
MFLVVATNRTVNAAGGKHLRRDDLVAGVDLRLRRRGVCPSWLRDWASEGCDHSAASASIIITIERCIDQGPDCGSVRFGRGRFVNGSSPFAAHLKLHYEAPVKAG